MKRWFWGVVTGIFLTFALFLAAGMIAWRFRQRPPEVEANTTLIMDVQDDIPEQRAPDIAGQILGSADRTTFLSLLQDIEKAAADQRITAILLKPANLQMGWGKLQQLRSALEQFQKRGKKVLVLLEVAGSREYFLASVADKIYLSPVGFLNLKGMRAEVMFFKDILGKIGVQADLEHIGRYKNFSDQFTDNHMSDAFREATSSMLDSIYGNFISTVAAARHRSAEGMRNLIEDTGPFEADRALRLGLVNQLYYEDQILDEIKSGNPNQQFHKLSMSAYSKVPASDAGLRGGDRIALVYAVGSITDGEDEFNPIEGGKTLGAKTMSAVFEEVGNDKSIKGVIVRIDSPGGDALASDNIWRGMVSLRKKKPMVISMSDEAASGGYYIAMTGDPLVAEPGTLTGSIGIVYGKVNLKGLYDKLGINKEIISRGKFSGMDSDYAPYTPEERGRVRELMNDFYAKFLARVATARKMTPEAVDKLAQGRVWTGEQAKNNGLIDDLGGFSRAMELMKQKAGLRPDARVELVEYPQRKNLVELLLGRAQKTEGTLPSEISQWLSQWKLVERVSQRPLWARMPYAFHFR